jgi:uncharacterized protein YecT (DUF1311 family)
VLATIVAPHAEAEMFGPDYQRCGDEPNTLAIVECLQAKTKASDQSLNAAYKVLQARIDSAQRQPLLTAQRLWVQYRDANCDFLRSTRRLHPAGASRRMHALDDGGSCPRTRKGDEVRLGGSAGGAS